jgi:hypothetical protein
LHIAHGQTEGVEIVLDAEKLQGVAAVAVDHFALEDSQACKLEGDIGGVGENREDGDEQAQVEASRWRMLRRRGFVHWRKDIT